MVSVLQAVGGEHAAKEEDGAAMSVADSVVGAGEPLGGGGAGGVGGFFEGVPAGCELSERFVRGDLGPMDEVFGAVSILHRGSEVAQDHGAVVSGQDVAGACHVLTVSLTCVKVDLISVFGVNFEIVSNGN